MPAARINPKIIIPPTLGLLESFWSIPPFTGIELSIVAATASPSLRAFCLCGVHLYAVKFMNVLAPSCGNVICLMFVVFREVLPWADDPLERHSTRVPKKGERR